MKNATAMGAKGKLRVGIVGLQPGRSWSAVAHLAALKQLSDTFDITGVANSSLESSQAAAKVCGIPRAFASVADMAASPDIDIITVTVKVPGHLGVVQAALEAGKHVYCEWPLGRDLEEAKLMAHLARTKGVLAVIGTQARVNPAVRHLVQMIQDGYVGKVRSATVSGWGRIWGDQIESLATDEYLLKRENGATMLTIPFAHMLAAFQDVLGDIVNVSAILETRIPQVYSSETGQYVAMDAADQVIVSGHFADNTPFSMHYRGGEPRGTNGFVWDIHGSEGDIRVTAATGHTQILPLTIQGARGSDRTLRNIPVSAEDDGPGGLISGNVARIYRRMAEDLRNGTSTAPTFDDAVELHQLLATIIQSSECGQSLPVAASNRRLP